MILSFLLHLYQPSVQEEKTLRDITNACYIPLIKSIKNRTNLRLTLNIPLSLIYQWEMYGYTELINSIKELYEAEKIELTSCGAYHPMLTRLSDPLVEKQIILNEYALGYYFGKNKGFEGEDALMLRNVYGFFPPEMAINQNLVKHLDSMGYSWVVADETAISINDRQKGECTVYNLEGLSTKIVKRNLALSNMLSFKKDINIDDIIEKVILLRQEGQDAVIAMDGEFFGHHNKEGIYIFDILTDRLDKLGVELATVSELVDKTGENNIQEIQETSWAATDASLLEGNKYPIWDDPRNKKQQLLWSVFNKVVDTCKLDTELKTNKDIGLTVETYPIWDFDKLSKLADVDLKNAIVHDLILLQCLNTDQFWWASNIDVGGKRMYDTKFIDKVLDLYQKYALITEDKDLIDFIAEKANEIRSLA